jgi:3-oxoacyl-[acyl-carrier-protein] synthase-3
MGKSETSEILATVTEADGSYGDLLYSDNVLSQQVSSQPPFQFGHEETAVRSYLRMDGRKVFPVAVRTMVRNVKEVVEKYNKMHPDDEVHLSQVDYVYPHQANMRIIQSVADGLEVPIEKVYSEGIAKYGNTSAASIPIGYVDNRDRTDDRLVVDVAFGAGLASGAILRRN